MIVPTMVDVGVFGARGVAFEADGVANLLHKLVGAWFHGFFQWIDGRGGRFYTRCRLAERTILNPHAFCKLTQLCFRKNSLKRG